MIHEFPTSLPMPNNDPNFKGIFGFLAIVVATLLVVYAAITGMSRHFEDRAVREDKETIRTSPSANASTPYFPDPREQPNPVVDLQTLRAREDVEITNYGWINKTSGIVRIPIDRAMDLILARQNSGGQQ